MSKDQERESTAPRMFHIGSQNDALYIISGEAPAQGNDHPRHDADRTCIAKVFDDGEARRLVEAANAWQARAAMAPAGEPSEVERLTRERNEWAEKWRVERRAHAELRFPGMNGTVRALGAAPAGEPVAWVRYRSDGGIEGPILHASIGPVSASYGAWTPLYAHPSPAAEVLRLADEMVQAALAYSSVQRRWVAGRAGDDSVVGAERTRDAARSALVRLLGGE